MAISPNDWKGESPGGLDFSEAQAVEFWARGEKGDEVVSFLVRVIDGNGMYRDTSRHDLKDVKLTKEWNKYRIDLSNSDLSRIKADTQKWIQTSPGYPRPEMTWLL